VPCSPSVSAGPAPWPWTLNPWLASGHYGIASGRRSRINSVEMEAAALYAFSRAREQPVLCFAHVTNQMGQAGDFEKGEANGATASIALVHAVADAWFRSQI
jgi:hypothetical protein